MATVQHSWKQVGVELRVGVRVSLVAHLEAGAQRAAQLGRRDLAQIHRHDHRRRAARHSGDHAAHQHEHHAEPQRARGRAHDGVVYPRRARAWDRAGGLEQRARRVDDRRAQQHGPAAEPVREGCGDRAAEQRTQAEDRDAQAPDVVVVGRVRAVAVVERDAEAQAHRLGRRVHVAQVEAVLQRRQHRHARRAEQRARVAALDGDDRVGGRTEDEGVAERVERHADRAVARHARRQAG
eukprot:scaffold88082_cov63-Phaeocystis_antarctica.AAC.1